MRTKLRSIYSSISGDEVSWVADSTNSSAVSVNSMSFFETTFCRSSSIIRSSPRGWSHRGSITLDKGYHKFEALMQEWWGGDGIKVAWKKPHDKDFSIIPGDYFYYGEIQLGETTNSTFLIPSSIYSFTSGDSYPITVTAYSLDGDVYTKTIFTVCS